MEKTIAPYSDVFSSLIDAVCMEKYPMALDIASFDKGNIIKMKIPATTNSYLQKSSYNEGTIGTKTQFPNVMIMAL